MSYNFCKTSFNRKYKTSKVNSFDAVNINLNDDYRMNFIKIFTIICDNRNTLTTHDHVAYLNVLVGLSKDLLTEYQDKHIFILSLFSIIKYSLWNDCKLVRTASLRCLRYYLLNIVHMELFLKTRLDFLIMRSLDLSYEDAANNPYRGDDDAERIHAMRILYRLSVISARRFPLTLISSLNVICAAVSDSAGSSCSFDIAIRPGLLILCQLLILNPNLSCKSEILRALQMVIFNPDNKSWCLNFRIIEAVLLTQLKLVTQSPWRSAIPLGYFNKTLTPFSILSAVQSAPESNYFRNFGNQHSDFETTSISILLTIFQSWSGLLYLFGSNNKPILSLTGLLGVGCCNIRGRILDFLFQLFDIYRPPAECKDFVSSLRAIADQNSSKHRSYWNLDDEFLVGQCNDCLPHISSNRINIIDNYQAVLLGMFIQCNLFEALENAVADDNESISSRAGILLANIAYKVSILLPADHPLSSRCDGNLLFNNPQSQKALLWIQQIHQILEQNNFEISPFLTYIIQQHPNHSVNDCPILTKRFLEPSNIDEILDSCYIPLDSVGKKNQSISSQQSFNKNYRVAALLDQTIRHSRIFEQTNEKAFYDLWDWDLLMVFTRSLVDSKNPLLVDKDSLFRVMRVLMKFFSIENTSLPCNNSNDTITQFASLPLTWKHSSNAAFVLTDIICFLVEYSKNTENGDELDSFLSVFRSCLRDCLLSIVEEKYVDIVKDQFGSDSSSNESSVFTEHDLSYKCCSYLILAVGRMSVSDIGENLLERKGIVDIFKAFLDYSASDVLTKLILGSLDYTRPSLGRSLLSIAIKSNNLLTRRYSTKFLKVLLRAKVPFFASWGVNLLVKQLHDCDNIVRQEAFTILQEASDDEVVVNNLLVESIATLHVGFQGYMLFSRLLSLPSHFDKLDSKNGIHFFLDNWNEKYNLEYCKTLDEQLLQYFTYYEIPVNSSDDPDENRMSNRVKYKSRDLMLPCHPYGSISGHKQGMDILLKRGDLQKCMDVIINEWQGIRTIKAKRSSNFLSVDKEELNLRSCMLAICHVATSPWGLTFTSEADIPLIISELTQFHPSLNVRGTGLLCLGLIGSTRKGADILLDYNWLSLRSDRLDKWPLLLDAFYNLQQSRINYKRNYLPNSQFRSPKMSNSFIYGENEEMEGNNTVGYSVFAIPLENDTDKVEKKSSIALMNDPSFIANNKIYKGYSKSIDESMFKARATTGTSSSSSTQTSESEQQTKLNKIVSHRREFSAGTASMFTIQSDEVLEAITPHDVLGIATMRRLQRKSRIGLFSKNHLSVTNTFTECNDHFCGDYSDPTLLGAFSNIKKSSTCSRTLSKRRKKLSGLLSPRSNLNKYRGLVLPINFNDITSGIFESNETLQLKEIKTEKNQIKDLNHEINNTNIKNLVQENETARKNESLSYKGAYGCGLFSFEESSCILDIALLANSSPQDSNQSDQKKSLRPSSDEQSKRVHEPTFLRPRATTTDNCSSNFINLNKNSNVNSNKSLEYHMIQLRNKSTVSGEDMSFNNCSNNGLMFHSKECCLNLHCQSTQVDQEVLEFRQMTLKSISNMLTISSKTKKVELNLARLKNSPNKAIWNDPCLYSEICILMSLYSFSRQSRQYLQELFLSIPMTSLQDDMKMYLQAFSQDINVRCSLSTRL